MISFILELVMTGLVVLDGFHVVEAQLRNVAVNKQTYQISTQGTYTSAKAVDGNTNGDFRAYRSCSYTGVGQRNPWWEVDLEAVYLVEHIVVYNRRDCCGNRLRDVYFDVSNDRTTYKRFIFHGGQLPNVKMIRPEGRSMPARWVKIYIKGPESLILTLCEVQVMAKYVMQKVHYDTVPEELKIKVNQFSVPVRVIVECIQTCTRPEEDFFVGVVDLASIAPYIECYCPI